MAARAPVRRQSSLIRTLGGVALVGVLTSLAGVKAIASTCGGSRGQRLILASEAVDPDVFVWDARGRLVSYAEGEWRDTRGIFAHTILAEPGTYATMISCWRSAHAGSPEAVGVRVSSGRYRGRYGWVLRSDVHFVGSAASREAVVHRSS